MKGKPIIINVYLDCENGLLEHFPPHRILKVKAIGEGISTSYPDKVKGT